MEKLKQHIIFKIAALGLILLVMMPAAIKLHHSLESKHKHEVCQGEPQAHFHTWDVDCDFQKFKITPTFTLSVFEYDLLKEEHNHELILSQYQFISEFQKSHISLRGPPFNS